MAQVTRLGLYGGPRAPYVGFVAAVTVQAAAVLMRFDSLETQFTLQTVAVEFVVSGAPGYDNLLTEAGENLFTEDGRLILLE